MKKNRKIILIIVSVFIFISFILIAKFTPIGYLLIGSPIFEVTHRAPNSLEWAYISVAKDTRWSELCHKISPKAYWDAAFSPRGHQIWLLRSECFYNVAFKSSNLELCKEVKPISNPFLDGSGISKDKCIKSIREGDWFRAHLHGEVSHYEIVLRQMGYSDKDIPQQFRRKDFIEYGLFFLSLGASEDFQRRLKALPDFSR